MAYSFFFDPVTPSEIESEILLTPLNKAFGSYSCPIRILKGTNHIVSATLAWEIMNMSVQTQGAELLFVMANEAKILL